MGISESYSTRIRKEQTWEARARTNNSTQNWNHLLCRQLCPRNLWHPFRPWHCSSQWGYQLRSAHHTYISSWFYPLSNRHPRLKSHTWWHQKILQALQECVQARRIWLSNHKWNPQKLWYSRWPRLSWNLPISCRLKCLPRFLEALDQILRNWEQWPSN